MLQRRKESQQTRLHKLLTKIRVRVNTKLGGENKLSFEKLSMDFPAYARCLTRITRMKEMMPQEEPVVDIKNIRVGKVVRSGITLVPAGPGGHMIRKGRSAKWS